MCDDRLGEEHIPPDEERFSALVLDQVVRMFKSAARSGKHFLRGFHAKSHGGVECMFTVEPGLPPELRVGLFAEPKTYRALIRFSNGSPAVQPDSNYDVRGMAIKVFDVPGPKVLEHEKESTTQDFLLCNQPSFFVRNVRDYADFTRAGATRSVLSLLGYFLGLNPFRWKFAEIRNLAVAMFQRVPSPLAIEYYSQTPYRFGEGAAVKYAVLPRSLVLAASGANVAFPDYLRVVMAEHLKRSGATFDFMVQRQTCPSKMPIEDPVVEWPESKSPYRKVATIWIPVQEFDTPDKNVAVENMSFTPWHCLPEHRPLGGINRVRRAVYETIARLRRDLNGVPSNDP